MDRCIHMSLKTKKRWTNISTGLFFLFGGIEYAIIMPTVYLYIQELGGDPSFLGVVLAAFSFTGLIAAPIFGILQDKYHNTKFLVLFANMFEIIGNFMYFMGINLMMLLGSRLIAGIGAGVGSSLFAQIARTTTEAERAAAISVAMAARQVGLLFGPGLNLFLQHFDFWIGPWKADAYSSAGLFMCALWILLQIFIFLFYFDLPPIEEGKRKNSQEGEESSSEDSQSENQESRRLSNNSNKSKLSQSLPANGGYSGSFEEGGIINIAPMWGSNSVVADARSRAFSTTSWNRELTYPTDHVDIKHDPMVNVDLEKDDLYDPPEVDSVKENGDQQNGSSGYGSTGQGTGTLSDEKRPVRTWQEEYLREEIVVLLASQFIFFFNQTVLETALTPMTQRLLNFGELENSILYCICGVEVVLGFIVVKYLSKFTSDRALLLAGFIIELISVVWLLIFYPNANPDEPYENLSWALIGVLSVVAGLPCLMVSGISLYSKLTSLETQEFVVDARAFNLMWFSIGVIVEVSGLAFIAVSVISLYSKVTSMDTQGFSQGIRRAVGGLATILGPLWAGGTVLMGYVMFGVMTFLFTFILILMALSWSKLEAPADIAKKEAAKANLVPSQDDSNDETAPLLINATEDDVEA
ncbi:uncharacterized protein [Amphiura filiformis]|uniref:uncharacterized protein n=1 Tax=Amphiura filiformis TaxID=82378 RepID=UPI003B2112BB